MAFFKSQILLFFFLSLFGVKSLCQDSLLKGKIEWSNYANQKNKLCDSILVDSRKIEFVEDLKTVFLKKEYSARLFKVNADVMIQLVCDYGNPANNIYGFKNFTFDALVIENKDINNEILDTIRSNRRSSRSDFVFDKTTTSFYDINIKKSKPGSSKSFITLSSSVADFGSRQFLYISYDRFLVIISANVNDKEIKIGNLISFKENITLADGKSPNKLSN